MDAPPTISFDHVEVKYSDLVYGLRGVTLDVQRGEFVFLVGQTGAGKSTVLKVVTREARHTAGRASLNGRDLSRVREGEVPKLRRQMGIIPQDFALLPNKRVWENVGYAMRAVGATRQEVRRLVPELLDKVSIGHRADAFPSELSGGEQQRVAIARALINDPPLLLADEPTGNLDFAHSMEIMELLLQLNLKGATVVVATHDIPVVERLGKRIVTFAHGKIIEDTGSHAPQPELEFPPARAEEPEPEPGGLAESAPTEPEIPPLTKEEMLLEAEGLYGLSEEEAEDA